MANQEYKNAACYEGCYYKPQNSNPCSSHIEEVTEITVCYYAAYQHHGKRRGDVCEPSDRSHDKFRDTYICSQQYSSKDTDKYLIVKSLPDAVLKREAAGNHGRQHTEEYKRAYCIEGASVEGAGLGKHGGQERDADKGVVGKADRGSFNIGIGTAAYKYKAKCYTHELYQC